MGSGDQGSLSSKAAYPHKDAVLPKALISHGGFKTSFQRRI